MAVLNLSFVGLYAIRSSAINEKDNRCTAIFQFKAWGERLVGVKPVRELLGFMTHVLGMRRERFGQTAFGFASLVAPQCGKYLPFRGDFPERQLPNRWLAQYRKIR
ncbi:MAG: hypothetical protein JSR83_03135 [Proteobacteria bacterium]|nr:hypothetical protein [Pseudomonadota bacterium]